MTESSLSDSYANRRRRSQFPENRKMVLWYKHCDNLEENPSQTVTHLRQLTDMTSRCFTHFPMSGALRGGKENRQGHPIHQRHLVPHATLQSLVRLMTHWVHRGIPGIWASGEHNMKMCIHSGQILACVWRQTEILFSFKFPCPRLQTIIDPVFSLPCWKQTVSGSLPIVALPGRWPSTGSQSFLNICFSPTFFFFAKQQTSSWLIIDRSL